MYEPVKEFKKKLHAWSTTCRQLSQESPFPALVTTYMTLGKSTSLRGLSQISTAWTLLVSFTLLVGRSLPPGLERKWQYRSRYCPSIIGLFLLSMISWNCHKDLTALLCLRQVSLCRHSWLGTHSVYPVCLELRDPPLCFLSAGMKGTHTTTAPVKSLV